MGKKGKPGRKAVNPAEKVILVGFYTKKKNVTAWGGMDKLREKCRLMAERPNTILSEA